MRVPGWKSMRQSTRWLRSRGFANALILGYHRIADVPHDPYGMVVNPDHFKAHLDVLRRNLNLLSLTELVERLRTNQLPRRALAVSFDDGYLDNLSTARPLLEDAGIPTTIFVTTGYQGKVFWWDELENLLLIAETLPPSMTLSINKEEFVWNPGEDRLALVQALYLKMLPLGVDERAGILNQIRMWSGVSFGMNRLVMTPSEVRILAQGDLIEIGAHTVTHPILDHLAPDAQRWEISESKRHLEEQIGKQIHGFSYPNGAMSSITRHLVREEGFSYACTSESDVVSVGSNPWSLPRFWIPNWDGETFSRWLSVWQL